MLTPEQIERRRLGIGASETAAALGLSKWMTPLELYQRKVNGYGDQNDEFHFRFGHAIEPFLLREYERATGAQLVVSPETMFDIDGPLLCHLDALVPGAAVVNAKSARNKDGFGEPMTDQVPTEYIIQEQVEMGLANVPVAHLPVLFFGAEFAIYEIRFDAELFGMIRTHVGEFWRRVQERDPPEPTTLAEAQLRWRQSREQSIELPSNVADAYRRLVEVRAQCKVLEEEGDKYEMTVKQWMGEAAIATVDGVEAATWRTSKPSHSFDSKRFEKDQPAIYKQYLIEKAGSRRFLLKG
jgi:predicted phage-related endonuclease